MGDRVNREDMGVRERIPGNRNSKYHGPVQVCLRVFEELERAPVAGAGVAGERRGRGDEVPVCQDFASRHKVF